MKIVLQKLKNLIYQLWKKPKTPISSLIYYT